MNHPFKFTLFATLISIASLSASFAQEWKTVASESGKVSVMVPGTAEKTTVTKKTLAGEIPTYIHRHRTDNVIIDLSFTPVKKGIVKFVGKNHLYKNAKGGVLNNTMGREKSFKAVTVSGAECMLLEYEIPNPADGSNVAYNGYVLMTVLEDGLYVANAIVKKEEGMDEIKKFADSIKIKP